MQVTDLEEECEALRHQSESEQAEKEKEIINLKSRIEFLEKLTRSGWCKYNILLCVVLG